MQKSTTTQMSDSFLVGIPVILSAGYMDVYTYLLRDGVFANAQTGNIILLAVRLAERQWHAALHYALPIAAFTAGILVSLVVRWNCKKLTAVHWRQLCLLMQAVILVLAAFPGESRNILSSCLVSLACGIQLQSFRALHGYPLATTMCIGNLRTATEQLFVFFVTGQRRSLRPAEGYRQRPEGAGAPRSGDGRTLQMRRPAGGGYPERRQRPGSAGSGYADRRARPGSARRGRGSSAGYRAGSSPRRAGAAGRF